MRPDTIKNTITFQEIQRLCCWLGNLHIRGKSLILTFFLWFFFGFFGIHRFYLGKYLTGALLGGLTLLGYLTRFILIGYLFWGMAWIGWAYDFLMLTLLFLRRASSS